jgi:hypothetical protein
VRLHCPACHVELSSDLIVIATLQKQFDDLLFTLPQTYGFFAHSYPPQNVPVKRSHLIRRAHQKKAGRIKAVIAID